ncbi:AAA domain-containing protein [Pestalotiopsis sp. NC0098]|nr:AAA domain-containing protein [Pestalotiopsis sp. NC0098]
MDECIRLEIEQAVRNAPKSQRTHERWSEVHNAVVVISDDDGVSYTNRRWLAPYGPQSIKSGGYSTEAPGIRTKTKMANAEFGYGAFEIHHEFNQSHLVGDVVHLSTITLSLKSASHPVHKLLSREEYEAFCRKFALHVDIDGVYQDVEKITFLTKASDLRYVEHRLNTDELVPESSVEAINNIARSCEKLATKFATRDILVECFYGLIPYRLVSKLSSMVTVAQNGPYDLLFKAVPKTRVFETADDLPSTLECAFTQPDFPVDRFDSVMEQTARLAIALRDEVMYTSIQMILAKKWPCHTFAFELPGHRVNGVVAGFFFVWPSPDFELVPQIGERFFVQLDDIPFRPVRTPKTVTPQEGREVITDHIFEAYVNTGATAGKNDTRSQEAVFEALDQVVRHVGDDKARKAWLMKEAIGLFPKSGTGKIGSIACVPTENPVDHRNRIFKWVNDMFAKARLRLSDQVLNRCPHLTAVRVTVPTWMERLGVIGAYVRSPPVPGTPKHKKPVPVVQYKIPIIKITSSLEETISTVRRNRDKFVFTSRFVRTAHGGQLKAGLLALSLSGQDTWELSGSNHAAFSRYIAKVSGDVVSYDLTTALPLLREFLDHAESNTSPSDPFLQAALGIYHKLDSDQKAMFSRTKDLPFGTAIVSGCPGSGKNHVTQLLMAIIQHSQVKRDVVQRWVETIVPAPGVPGDTGGALPTTNFCVPEFAQSAGSQAQLLIIAPSNDMLDKIAEDMSNLYSTLGVKKRLCRVQTPDNATKNMTSPLNPDDSTIRYDKEEVDEGGDALEAEIYLRSLSKDCFDNHRTSAAPGGEYAVSALVAKRIENAPSDDDLVSRIRDLQELRANEPETFYHEHFGELQKLLRSACDEEYLRADVLLSTPEAFYKLAVREVKLRVTAVWQDEAFRMTEPEALIALQYTTATAFVRMFTGDDKQCKPVVTSLYAHKNKNTSMVFCSQFGEQLQLSLPGRMIKAGFRAHYLNINHRARGGVSRFPSQQYYGGRMIEARSDVPPEQKRVKQFFNALTNWSSKSNTAVVVNLSGDNEKKVGTSFTNPTSIAVILDILRLVYKVHILCDKLPTANEDGELISVLVVFPYKAQMMLFRRELAKLSPSDLPFHKIKSGCVPSIQGGEASLVIFDGVRDVSPGFTGSSELHNTALTRAIFGYITIQSDQLWTRTSDLHPDGLHPKDSRIRNILALHQYCDERIAIVELCGPLDIEDVSFPGKHREEPMSSLVKAGTHLPQSTKRLRWKPYHERRDEEYVISKFTAGLP